MEEFVYYNNLYDLYSNLLTSKQQSYFKDYYFDNLSFSEMAEKYAVSRNAIFKQLHIAIDKLVEYEEKLNLYKKSQKIIEILELDNIDLIKKELNELI